MNTNDIDIHKIAEEWYNQAIIPCRREIQQDICAWSKDDDSKFKEVILLGFFYGYLQALEDTKV